MSDLREAWAQIRAMVETDAKQNVSGVMWHDRPYGLDAGALDDALSYIDDVVSADNPTVSFTPDQLNIGSA